MTLITSPTLVERIKIVDDNEDQRESLRDALEDVGYEATVVQGQFTSPEQLAAAIMDDADAAICDHDLRPSNFASFLGAEVVAELYKRQFPVLLVTAYTKSDIDTIRPYRRFIPVLLTPDEVNHGIDEGLIAEGFQICREEFGGIFRPSRKPHRTLMRILRTDLKQSPKSIEVVLSSWTSDEAIRLPLEMLPEELHQYANIGERFYAMVNVGADTQEELFFEYFEYRGPGEGVKGDFV